MSVQTVIHSKLGFSSRKRWRICPVSVHLSANLPGNDSTNAQEGTIAHAVAEHYARQAFKLPGWTEGEAPAQVPPADLDLKGRTVEEWNAELRHHGRAYVEYVRSLLPPGGEGFAVVEQKVAIPSISPLLFGTGDLFIWVPSIALLIAVDYKYGFEDVDVGGEDDTNPQIAAYLVAAAETFNLQPRRLIAAVYQPRRVIGMAGQHVELSAEWLQTERDKLRAEVAAVEAGANAAPVPGTHCRYCNAARAGVCPTVHEGLTATVANMTGERQLHQMTDDEVVELWACRTPFKVFWDDVQQRIENLAKTGHARLQVKTQDGRRKWRDERDVVLTLLALNHADLLAPKALSEVFDQLPPELRDELITRTNPTRKIELVAPGTPSQQAKLFKKYSKLVDERIKAN